MKTKTKTRSYTSIIWLIAVAFIAVGLLLFCQFYFGDSVSNTTTFYKNTFVNGVDISGLTKEEANTLLQTDLENNIENISITLQSGDKSWKLSGSDFEIVGNFENSLNSLISYGREGNIFEKKKIENKIKKEGLYINVPYNELLGGVDEKLDNIILEIESPAIPASIVFNPDDEVMFSIKNGENGLKVDRTTLMEEINNAISSKDTTPILIPFEQIMPEESLEQTLENIALRSKFSTDISTSSQNRKDNVKKALSAFNGMIVEPNQIVSFNDTTGSRSAENGYKNAVIIFNGSYTSGVGGGVCQVSTTLYNALLRADLEIIEVCHHTLPPSYVPLSFDAMVSEGYADLIFKNNQPFPIYIKAYSDGKSATCEIYGQPLEEGLTITTKSELVKIIGHNGDKIISDTKGEYSNHVLYKGEYYRLKYPQEGYITNGYLVYKKNGEIIEEKKIRHDKYSSQNGVIVEGVYEMEEGMKLDNNGVKYIAPQKVTQENYENAKKKYHLE